MFSKQLESKQRIGLFVYCTWLASLCLIVDRKCALIILALVTIFDSTTITINLIHVTFYLIKHDLQV